METRSQKPKGISKSLHLKLFKSQTGSFGVFTAILMIIIIGILAFVLNLGFLYTGKNKYQNAVEAAAMAGAMALCNDDPEFIAREILLANLGYSDFPEGYTVEIFMGYYDETGEYNFSGTSALGYKSFIEEENMPGGEYINSVLIKLTVNNITILPGFLEDNKDTPVQATAIAYLKRYGILSTGEDSDDGITLIEANYNTFPSGFPAFHEMGYIHANSLVNFSAGSPSIDAYSYINSGYNVVGIEGDAPVETIIIPKIKWDKLATEADVIITRDYFQEDPNFDNDGNVYIKGKGNYFNIGFKDGLCDHKYYLDPSGFPSDSHLIIRGIHQDIGIAEIRNISFSIGGDNIRLEFSGTNFTKNGIKLASLIIGDDYPDTVYFYTKGDVGGPSLNFMSPSINPGETLPNIQFRGVFIGAEGDISMKCQNSGNSAVEVEHKVRLVSNGKISLYAGGPSYYVGVREIYNGNFGPPCPPYIVRLGVL